MNMHRISKELYSDDKYYIYKSRFNGKTYFARIEEDAGGLARIDKNEVPDNILCEISKELI